MREGNSVRMMSLSSGSNGNCYYFEGRGGAFLVDAGVSLRCLSSSLVEALENYDQAIRLYPYMGDAYYNRGLVLIYLKDKEKGCIDLSRAGELGVADSYSVFSKYCSDENN